MKLELKLDGKTYWVEFKKHFTRKEMKQWYEAQEPRFPTPKKDNDGKIEFLDPAVRDKIVGEAEMRMLALLCQWCPTCFLEDVEGTVYNSLKELTPEILDGFDWGLLDFVFNIPIYARAKRSRLGEVVGLPLSSTMRKR